MVHQPLPQDIRELSAIWHDLLRLQPRLKAMLPTNLARESERLRLQHTKSGARRAPDYSLIYRAGIVLAQHAEPMTMGALGEELDVPLSTATRIVDWFVQIGYVRRIPDEQDRRIVHVAFTPSGKKVFQELDRFVQHHVAQILEHFTPQERKDLIALMRKMVRVLEESASSEIPLQSK
jgi:DNA-binding MarR family transcriptional regulator